MPVRDDNRWIVSSHRFREHRSPDVAEAERKRLSEAFPKLDFRLYRIKRVLVTEQQQAALDQDAVNELAGWTGS